MPYTKEDIKELKKLCGYVIGGKAEDMITADETNRFEALLGRIMQEIANIWNRGKGDGSQTNDRPGYMD